MSNIEINRQTRNITVSEPRADYHLPIASATTLGGIKVGENLSITSDGTLSAESTEYTLPVASSSTLGGIKVGSNLSISDSVLTANVDSVLNISSNNPVKNTVITSNINSINSTLSEYDTRIDNLEDNYSTLSSTVSTNTSNISDNASAISNLTTEVSGYSDAISTNTSNIAANALAIGGLDDRLDDAESTITDQGNAINDMGSEIEDFTLTSDIDVTYSYILPASTWTQGKITYSRRGKIGLISFDLVGNMTLASRVDIQVYQLPDTFQNSIVTRGTLNTNLGPITVKIDASRNITFYNETSSSMSQITRVAGQLVVVLE